MEYVFPQNTSIRNVATIRNEIANLMAVEKNLVIDMSHVTHLDTSIVQLLAVVNEHVMRNEGVLTWKNPSNDFTAALKILGLNRMLPTC